AALAPLAVAFRPGWPKPAWGHGMPARLDTAQAINVWLIQLIVAIGPPLGGLAFKIYMKTDWGISLFFLVPLSLVAMPSLRVPAVALFRITAIWLIASLAPLLAAAPIATYEMANNPNGAHSYGSRSRLARELPQAWHQRFGSPWALVAANTEIGEPMTFYSPDHPAPFTPGEVWASGLTS